MMGRKRRYERTTGYVPYEERRFFVDAVHRPEPDLGILTELFIRLALERVACKLKRHAHMRGGACRIADHLHGDTRVVGA